MTSPPSPLRRQRGEVALILKDTYYWHTSPELWEKLKPLARQNRKEPTEAEEKLWENLCNRQLEGFKFRRQHAIERFIVDFYCAEARLVVEVDGPIHQYSREEDFIRQNYFESQYLRILRFSNEDILNDLDVVLNKIAIDLTSPLRLRRGDTG
jgi:very-short-patch-repair endonuclease